MEKGDLVRVNIVYKIEHIDDDGFVVLKTADGKLDWEDWPISASDLELAE